MADPGAALSGASINISTNASKASINKMML